MQPSHPIEKHFYSISEVADMLKVAPSLIRFWETEFPQIAPRKNQKGNRQFTKKDIEILQTIYHLVKEKGYTLEGANRILKKKHALDEGATDIAGRLIRIRKELIAIQESLDQ